MPPNHRRRKVKPHNRRNKRKGRGNEKLVIYRQVGRFCPDRTITKLRWNDTTTYRSNTGQPAQNFYFRSSGYDPDPAVLTGSIPGFVELANLYHFYRVHAMQANVEMANHETAPVMIGGWPSSIAQNLNSLTASDCLEFAGNVGGRVIFLGANGAQSVRKFKITATGKSLYGPTYLTDMDFAADTSSNPTAMFYINLFEITDTGNFSYGIGVRTSIFYTIEFFGRRSLET